MRGIICKLIPVVVAVVLFLYGINFLHLVQQEHTSYKIPILLIFLSSVISLIVLLLDLRIYDNSISELLADVLAYSIVIFELGVFSYALFTGSNVLIRDTINMIKEESQVSNVTCVSEETQLINDKDVVE